MSQELLKASSMLLVTLALTSVPFKSFSQNANNADTPKDLIAQGKEKLPKEKEIKIDKVAKSSIKLLNDIVLHGDLNLAKKNNELEGENLEPLNRSISRSQRKNSFLKKIKKSYKALKSDFVVKKFEVENNIVTIVLQEITEITENKVDPDQNFVPKYAKLHEFKFDVPEKNNKLQLVGYTALDDPEEINSKQPEEIESIPLPSDAVPAIVDIDGVNILEQSDKSHVKTTQTKSIKSRLLNKFQNSSIYPQEVFIQGQETKLLAQTYGPLDRAGMVVYANRWWNDFNPNYRNYTDIGGDCTNYASQILHEGGKLKFIKESASHDDPTAWWYNKNSLDIIRKRQSNSWSNAVWFYTFVASYPAIARPVDRTSSLDVGDIVQVDFGGVGQVSHTMIVTSKRASDSMIFLTGHTNPHLYLPVYDIIASNPKNRLYTWKLVI